jgi:hypothetical protein
MTYHAGNALRPDLVLLPLDDDVVAFSEAAQSLVSLNAAAAVIVNALQAGKQQSEIVRSLASEAASEPQQAQEWVDTVLNVLGSGGFLADRPLPSRCLTGSADHRASPLPPDMPAYVPFEPVLERRYRLLETCLLIRFGERSQARMVNSVIGHLATDDDTLPTLEIDISAKKWGEDQIESFIYRNAAPAGYAARLSFLGPMVKGIFWTAAINAHRFLFYIHAGVIGAGEGCVLFPAAPGSGKSSLTAAMTAKGFRYFSDEVALVETANFDVQPMPLAFCAKRSGWDVMARYLPEILRVPTHRRLDGKDVRYLAPPANRVQHTSARVSHIIFPKYVAGAETRLVSVSRADALRRLMEECLALGTHLTLEEVRGLIDSMSRIDCYALTFSSLDEAVTLVSGAVGGPQGDCIKDT